MATGTKKTVLSAIAGNFVVMLAKLAGFFLTGSGALLSEAIHTFADFLNQVLLYVGIRSSERGPDRLYPYGYGAERYVWSLMSAVGIFFLGCGVTVYHGVSSLLHPEPFTNIGTAVAVLVFAFLIEGYVLGVAYSELRKASEGRPFLRYLKKEADPTAVAVLLEDLAACGGVVLALVSILLSHLTGQVYWDAIGSILIGLLLGVVAIFLIARNRGLLVGQSIPEEDRATIHAILRANPAVEKVVRMRSRVLSPDSFRIQADIEFDGAFIADKLEAELAAEYGRIANYEDFQVFARRYADRVIDTLGDEVDAIEARIRHEVPEAKHLDIETE